MSTYTIEVTPDDIAQRYGTMQVGNYCPVERAIARETGLLGVATYEGFLRHGNIDPYPLGVKEWIMNFDRYMQKIGGGLWVEGVEVNDPEPFTFEMEISDEQ